jgi:hypothetical protein
MFKAEILEIYEVINPEVRNVTLSKICSYVPAKSFLDARKNAFFAPLFGAGPLGVVCLGGISDSGYFEVCVLRERTRLS